MPLRSASSVTTVRSAGGVSPTAGTKVRCEPGMIIKGPLTGWLSVSATEKLSARGTAMPSSECQVSKSACQPHIDPLKADLRLTPLWCTYTSEPRS